MITLGWYRSAVVFASTAIFFTNFSDYSQRWGLIPLFWIVVLGGLAAPLAVPALFAERFRLPPLVIWATGFLLITIAWYFPSVQNGLSFQNLQTRILSVLFLGLMLFVLAQPRQQHIARVAVAFAVLIAVAFNIYELFNPLTFSDIPGRASGLYTNVNQSGAALMLGMIIAYGVVPSRLRMPFVALTAVGIIATFSRAAMIGWIVVVLYFALRSGLGVTQIRRIVFLCALVGGFLLSPYWANLQATLEERGTLTLDVLERLQFMNDGTLDASSSERARVAVHAWRLWGQQPFLGYGTGHHRQFEEFTVSTHNAYLAMMVDHGILGLFILPTLVLAALWGARRSQIDLALPFALFVLLWGFFSHNILEERYVLFAVALVGSIVATNRVKAPKAAVEPAPLRLVLPAGAMA
jgi:hypothetical protein